MSNDDFKPRLGRIRDDGRAKGIRHSTRVIGEAVRNAARPLRRNSHIDPNAHRRGLAHGAISASGLFTPGARRVIVKRPGELGTVLIAHKVPVGRDPDQAPLAVLDAILGDGKSSRLYRELVDKGLALDAGAEVDVSHDLSLHVLYASLAPDAKMEDVEKALWTSLKQVQEHGVTEPELDRVKNQWRAQQAYKRDGTSGVASGINEYVGIGDWTLYVRFPEMVQKVSTADVQRVARQYFTEDTSTTGWYVPTRTGDAK